MKIKREHIIKGSKLNTISAITSIGYEDNEIIASEHILVIFEEDKTRKTQFKNFILQSNISYKNCVSLIETIDQKETSRAEIVEQDKYGKITVIKYVIHGELKTLIIGEEELVLISEASIRVDTKSAYINIICSDFRTRLMYMVVLDSDTGKIKFAGQIVDSIIGARATSIRVQFIGHDMNIYGYDINGNFYVREPGELWEDIDKNKSIDIGFANGPVESPVIDIYES